MTRQSPRPARARLLRLLAATVLLAVAGVAGAASLPGQSHLEAARERFERLERSRALLVYIDGSPALEHVVRGPGLETPVNIKSLSKTVLAGLVGIAIERGVFAGLDQPVTELLGDRVPPGAAPRVAEITVGHLLSMQAGLERTSGANYGAWVTSDDWVAYALSRPFAGEPGGRMRYSTGNSHLLSAALVERTGRSTLALAREWLGAPLDITVPDWLRDPQGVHFGGNEMRLSPRGLARFGEMVRNGGMRGERRVLPEAWIEQSWTPRGRSRFNNDDYGLGWFITDIGGRRAYYGWGFGGQMLYVIPELAMTVVMTADPTPPSSGTRYLRELEALVADALVPAAEAAGHSGAAPKSARSQ